tara:strand:+ start:1927 stop:2361 length:435 start_codon:yes stop_codon:yes gene_type:complete
MNGKGDKNRTIDKKTYDKNYDRIFRNAKTAQLEITDLNWDGDLTEDEVNDWHVSFDIVDETSTSPEDYYKNIEVVTHSKQHLISRIHRKYPKTLESLSQHPGDGWNEEIAKRNLEWAIMMDFLRSLKYEDDPVQAAEDLYNSFK